MPFNFTLVGTEDYQTYGVEREFEITDSVNFALNYEYRNFHNYEDNAIMFSVNGIW
jgi:hypothetical protein